MKRKIKIVIINGKPQSGKDTVIGMIKRFCHDSEYARCYAYSTIDPVKNVLTALGWDGEKNDEVRNMLASLKQFWVDSCDGPFKYCMDTIIEHITDKHSMDDLILIFQIREQSEIKKLINALKPMQQAYGFDVSTLFVIRRETEKDHYENPADEEANDLFSDTTIYNDSSLECLEDMVINYVEELLGGTQ